MLRRCCLGMLMGCACSPRTLGAPEPLGQPASPLPSCALIVCQAGPGALVISLPESLRVSSANPWDNILSRDPESSPNARSQHPFLGFQASPQHTCHTCVLLLHVPRSLQLRPGASTHPGLSLHWCWQHTGRKTDGRQCQGSPAWELQAQGRAEKGKQQPQSFWT